MALKTRTAGDVVIVSLGVEELGAENAPQLKDDVAPALEASARVVLDLSGVRLVDSSGLGFFLSCLRKVNARGGDLKLCCASRNVRAVLELVRLHRILEVHDTPEDAVRAFQP